MQIPRRPARIKGTWGWGRFAWQVAAVFGGVVFNLLGNAFFA